jgi:uncharacterized protein (TIGR03000 family)
MDTRNSFRLTIGVIAVAVLLAAGRHSAAQEQGWPINHPSDSASFPWNSSDYRGYDEPAYATQDITTSAPTNQPEKYRVNINPLSMMKNTEDPKAVTLVAHVPENAQIWFFDKPTTSRGKSRLFYYPNLAPGSKYSYTVRIAWVEDGKVVSQTQTFSVTPGEVHCIHLTRNGAEKVINSKGS